MRQVVVSELTSADLGGCRWWTGPLIANGTYGVYPNGSTRLLSTTYLPGTTIPLWSGAAIGTAAAYYIGNLSNLTLPSPALAGQYVPATDPYKCVRLLTYLPPLSMLRQPGPARLPAC